MQVKSIAEYNSAILLTCIKLPFVTTIFVLSIFEWMFYTGFTVHLWQMNCTILDHVVRENDTSFIRKFSDLIQPTIATLFRLFFDGDFLVPYETDS